jgi:hypothetical protein
MSLYGSFVYGGIGVGGSFYGASISMTPNTGVSDGGTVYYLDGYNLNKTTYNDEFESHALSPTLWSTLDTGSGASMGGASHLLLQTGTTVGSTSGVESMNGFYSTQYEIEANLIRPFSFPVAVTEFLVWFIC